MQNVIVEILRQIVVVKLKKIKKCRENRRGDEGLNDKAGKGVNGNI